MKYRIETQKHDGITTYQLIDTETRVTCEIVPSIGNNLIRYDYQGESYLSMPPKVRQMKDKVTCYQYGSAILFPPNRVKNATFCFNDKVYQLPRNDGSNHLHGDLCHKEWTVIKTGVDTADGCYIVSQFKIEDHPDIESYFPHKLVFTLKYTLKDGELKLKGSVKNKSETVTPYALGFHPYFPIPKGKEEDVLLKIPAKEEWPISRDAFIQGPPEKTKYSKSISKGITLENIKDLDCWFISLDRKEDANCEMTYQSRGTRLSYRIDTSAFPFMVIFKPDWSSSISLEPYSYLTDGFNLPWNNEITGVKGINPGEQLNYYLSIIVESL